WALNQNYLHKSIDVSFLSGQTSVIFRFVASTSGIFNGGYNIDGVLIDNFRIDALGFIPLALDVTSLSGQAVNNTTKLRWTASNSIDLETFYVNRSKDGLSFEQIGFIKSQNGSSEYSFDDLFPEKGTQYYQIVSKDYSGENRFSNIIKINHGVEQTLKFYPNPTGVNEYFTIKGSDGTSDFINIQIIDMFGRSIYDKSALVKSKGKVSIDKPGIYIIQAESTAGEIHSGKIIIY
ncbi:MAG TPA: T9SS type A sorting domain-containing protein, partial [Saprospiraceae bacterium]|nr:T9SS type A sorting domain-containing protein [Saprospiraceae bacterium]